MNRTRFLCALTAVICAVSLASPALATQMDAGNVYRFRSGDFSGGDTLAGIWITAEPEGGMLMLGSRVLRAGDVLTAEQIDRMTFHPRDSRTDLEVSVSCLPIYTDRVNAAEVMSIEVIGKSDQAPVAEDSALETYRNLPNEGLLKAKDPEGQPMTFTVTRLPKRGEAVIREDGSFIYTPKKNKVGIDSFTYTATDPAGNVSREATVTVTILKPSEASQYTDTAGKSCRFAAEWMKNTGIFVGESINGNGCFQPEKEVSRGDFLTMLVGALEIPAEADADCAEFTADAPLWLRPYLAAALRSGLTAGLPEGGNFRGSESITGAEAAVMIQNALDLTVETVVAEESVPVWAQQAVSVLADHGINLDARAVLTRGQAAEILYRVVQLKADAPGSRVIRSSR